jgi:hypothetical protein
MFIVQSYLVGDWLCRWEPRRTCDTMAQAQSMLASLDTMPGAMLWRIVAAEA